MNLAGYLLKWAGWKLDITVEDYPKCIICVAPHTSNWDFILGKLAYAAIGRKACFLMKEAWFFWPMGCIMRALGGIAVPPRGSGGDLVNLLIDKFKHTDRLQLAITPEGTRSRTDRWRTGFLRIAYTADVPIVLGAIDFKSKTIIIQRTFKPSGDIDSDMRRIKNYYSQFTGKYPEKFSCQ